MSLWRRKLFLRKIHEGGKIGKEGKKGQHRLELRERDGETETDIQREKGTH